MHNFDIICDSGVWLRVRRQRTRNRTIQDFFFPQSAERTKNRKLAIKCQIWAEFPKNTTKATDSMMERELHWTLSLIMILSLFWSTESQFEFEKHLHRSYIPDFFIYSYIITNLTGYHFAFFLRKVVWNPTHEGAQTLHSTIPISSEPRTK